MCVDGCLVLLCLCCVIGVRGCFLCVLVLFVEYGYVFEIFFFVCDLCYVLF